MDNTDSSESARLTALVDRLKELARSLDLRIFPDTVPTELTAIWQTRDALAERLAAQLAANENFRRARGRGQQNDVANSGLPD